MKKVHLLAATMVVMSLTIALPINAQSRKDKKAAKKAQWEMEQKQKLEESELRHQLKIDSIANAQKSHAITCYRLNRLRSGWSKVTKHGSYNAEDRILFVENEKFNVSENPYYGEDSTPGQYQYKAGPYYFNE